MLSWLFKKRGDVVVPATAIATSAASNGKAEARAQKSDEARAEWATRLQSAQGDESALLAVARTAPLLDIRCAAVEALHSEAALKRAERELRGQDSRVHRTAKLRLAAAVAQREARARAVALIDTATMLAGDALPPANRLVALDRDWQALDVSLLTADQVAAFAGLRDRLNASVQANGELQHRVHSWSVEARQALVELQHAAADASEPMDSRCETAIALRQSRPDVPATLGLDQALQAALEAALEAVRRASARVEHDRLAALAAVEGSRLEANTVAPPMAAAASGRPDPGQLRQLEALIEQAEAALADGQFGAMQQHLQEVDAACRGLGTTMLDDSLRMRRQVLHAERARLRDWQQWGGAQAIDALLAEAADLAATTAAASDPEGGGSTRLHFRTHAASIQALRLRWNEMGRLGAAAPRALWQRFDADLQAAFQPVAAQQAAMKAARQDNLRAREALLDVLEGVPALDIGIAVDDTAAHWKRQLRALGDFQLAWRQLGPVEHTVPAGARDALLARLRSSVERIEAPIQEARRVAEAQREQLIARAEALAQDCARHPAQRDAALRVRELQAEWQQHARTLPLARAAEAALWARFKAATDTVFAQRDAAVSARDAELAANLAAREALLARLSALAADADEAEARRTLAEVDRAWRQPIDLPGTAAGAIDARFRSARAAAAQALADAARRRWEGQCDTLMARLALCEQREAVSLAEGDLANRWAALDGLPPAWQQALEARWSEPVAPGPLTAAAMGDLLLQLEAAFDLPASPEQQAARRDLKLRALKATLEGRGAQAIEPSAQRAQWLAAALRQGLPAAGQGERLLAVIKALRESAPD